LAPLHPEIVKYPWGHAFDIGELPEGRDLPAVDFRLIILAEKSLVRTFFSDNTICPCFGYHHRSVRIRVAPDSGKIVKIRLVPAVILVEPDDIDMF